MLETTKMRSGTIGLSSLKHKHRLHPRVQRGFEDMLRDEQKPSEVLNSGFDSIQRPYLTRQSRQRLFEEGDAFLRKAMERCGVHLREHDAIHIPFSSSEREKILRFLSRNGNRLDSLTRLADWVPGRTVLDIKRYLSDEFEVRSDGIVVVENPKLACPSHLRNTQLIVTRTSGPLPTIISRHPSSSDDTPSPRKNMVQTLYDMESDWNAACRTKNLETIHWERLAEDKLKFRRLAGQVAHGDAGAVSSCIHDLQLGKHSHNEHILAIGLGEHQEPHEDHALLLDTNTGELKRLEGHTDGVSDLQWAKSGRYLFTGSRDRKVNVYDSRGTLLKHRANEGFKSNGHYHPDTQGRVVSLATSLIGNDDIVAIGREMHSSICLYNHSTKSYDVCQFDNRARASEAAEFTTTCIAFGNKQAPTMMMVGMESEDRGGGALFDFGNGRLTKIGEINPNPNNDQQPVCMIQEFPDFAKFSFVCSLLDDDHLHIYDTRAGNGRRKEASYRCRTSNLMSGDRGDHVILNGSFQKTGYLFQTSGSDHRVMIYDYRRFGADPVYVFEHDTISTTDEGLVAIWSSDFLISAVCTSLKIWDLSSGDCVKELNMRNGGTITTLEMRERANMLCGATQTGWLWHS